MLRDKRIFIIKGNSDIDPGQTTACIQLLADKLLAARDAKLTQLSLFAVPLEDEALVHLAHGLASNATLVRLDLTYCNISANGARSLLSGLLRNTTLRTLVLDDNPGVAGAVGDIATWLATNPSLKTLSLSNVGMRNESLAKLGTALSINRRLRSLDLSRHVNLFGDLTLLEFSQTVRGNSTLAEIRFEGCRFRRDHLQVPATPCTCKHNHSDVLADAIGTLVENTRLRTLKLSYSNVPSQLILDQLRRNPDTLRYVSLADAPSVPDTPAIELAFPKTLSRLRAPDCNFDARWTANILDAMRKLPSPQSLDLSGSTLTDESTFHLATCLRKGLRKLVLNGCRIEPPFAFMSMDAGADAFVATIAPALVNARCTELGFDGLPARKWKRIDQCLDHNRAALMKRVRERMNRLAVDIPPLGAYSDLGRQMWNATIADAKWQPELLPQLRAFGNAGMVDRATYFGVS